MRSLLRGLVVAVGFIALLAGMQQLMHLLSDEWPDTRMTLAVSGRDEAGRPVNWDVRILEGGSIFLGPAEMGRDDATSEVAPRRAVEALFARLATLKWPLRIAGKNREVETEWTYEANGEGGAELDGHRATPDDLRARMAGFLKTQAAVPTARLEGQFDGRGKDGAPMAHTFRIGPEGKTTLDGEPSSADALLKLVESAAGRLTLEAKVFDKGWTLAIDTSGAGSRGGSPLGLAQLKVEIETFVLGEKIARTTPPTVQDVLDLKLPEFTIRKVDLPGFPYKKAYPDATDEPEVVIKSYSGHPMYEDPAKMPDMLKEFHPGPFEPAAERLPENPAVLRGLDPKYPIGRYSATTRETDEGGLMIWRRASADTPVALYRKIGYPALVRFDGAGRLQPNIAWKWEISPDNRVFTFWLRKGHKWSDGKPFTTEDMLFALNTGLLNPRSKNAPLWVQQTDGFSLLSADDILDWPGLAARILREADADKPSVGRQIARVAAKDTTRDLKALFEMLRAITPSKLPNARTRARIVGKLNSVLSSRTFYDEVAWQGVDFERELKTLMAKGYSHLSRQERRRVHVCMWRNDRLKRVDATIDGQEWSIRKEEDNDQWLPGDVTRFNVVMFRAAYAGLVAPAELRQVKIEAVPDAAGDTSHIIRFTFPQPSSTFLDSLATFMVYLYMCGKQKDYFEPYHPNGVKEMLAFDVLDWGGLVEQMQEEAAAARPSPGKHIWPMLSEKIRARLADDPPTNTRHEEDDYKREVVAELNRLLRTRTFYDATAWAGVDFDRELAEWLDQGYSALQIRHHFRVRYLLRRKDYLRRGAADLSDEELAEFNLMMLRAAYDGQATETSRDDLVGVDRETALDAEAEFRGFRSYSILYQEMQHYDRKWQPHVPTLCPWRIVSEKEDQQIRAVRNPYYFKVDVTGQQLPYCDMLIDERATRREIRLLKLRSGKINFQTRNLEFDDFTSLKQNEKAGNYEVRLWANDFVGEMTIIICQQHADPEYRLIQGNPLFRQALSLALNRQEMINIVWSGMGTPAQFSIPLGSDYYNRHLYNAFVDYDPERAGKLLDEMGLKKKNREGIRLLPSGRPFHLEVSTEEERPLAAVQLACNYWRAVGINAQMKVRSGMIKWRLYQTGKWDIWIHKEGGNYFGPLDAGTIAPQHPASSVHISRWCAWLRSGGREGEEPPDHIKDLDFMWQRVLTAPNKDKKLEYWQDLMERTAREVPVLGIMTSPGKVVLVSNTMRNVPKLALAGWIAHSPGNTNPEVWHVREDD